MTHGEASTQAREERYRMVRAELLARLRPICNSMPNDIFLDMVESMTTIQVKYEMRDVTLRR